MNDVKISKKTQKISNIATPNIFEKENHLKKFSKAT
jgi:hypothetical protein